MLYSYGDHFPQIHQSVFCSESADIIGDVSIGEHSSVWFRVVIRGDVNQIRIGARSNIQDGSVIHVSHDTYATTIGDDVTVGHNVTLHGCTIGHRCLIGMGAIVLDGAIIEEDAMVAAGALVSPGTIVKSRTLYIGSPAKYKRDLSADEVAGLAQAAQNYIQYSKNYLRS
jgi:carbonic anhydrase/acetyltransferase-like protein (isoleucine patch superfamily)